MLQILLTFVALSKTFLIVNMYVFQKKYLFLLKDWIPYVIS